MEPHKVNFGILQIANWDDKLPYEQGDEIAVDHFNRCLTRVPYLAPDRPPEGPLDRAAADDGENSSDRPAPHPVHKWRLDNNLLRSFHNITEHTELQLLSIKRNALRLIPDELNSLTNLVQLNLSHNKLQVIADDALCNLECLERLSLRGNKLTEFPRTLMHCTRLTGVDLSLNAIRHIDDYVGEHPSLERINLSTNSLDGFPLALCALGKQLTHLDLMDNMLTAVPMEISQLVLLRHLSLRSNRLMAYPEPLLQLSSLRLLNMSNNLITELPELGHYYPDMRILALQGNHLTELPESIGLMTEINTLSVRGNQLRRLPDSITHLSNLRWLYAFDNKLEELPEDMGAMQSMTSLWLQGNKLRVLPPSLTQMTNLQQLDLRNNNLLFLPHDLGSLVQLESLQLGHNSLALQTMLPRTLGKLTNLQTLNINECGQQCLPAEMARLNLRVLDKRSNPFHVYRRDDPTAQVALEWASQWNEPTSLDLGYEYDSEPSERTNYDEQGDVHVIAVEGGEGNEEEDGKKGEMEHEDEDDEADGEEEAEEEEDDDETGGAIIPFLWEWAAHCVLVNEVPYEEDMLPYEVLDKLHGAEECTMCQGPRFATTATFVQWQVIISGLEPVPMCHEVCFACALQVLREGRLLYPFDHEPTDEEILERLLREEEEAEGG